MKIQPLKASLSLTEEQAEREIELRKTRGDELARTYEHDPESFSSEQVKELRQLNADLERLEKLVASGECLLPHPGHALPRGTRRGNGTIDSYGRVKGLGDAFIEKAALDGTSGGTLVPAFFHPGIRDLPQRRLFVRSVIPTVRATSDKVDYLRQEVVTHAAAAVAAGGLKPTSTYTVERVTESVTTIAHVTEALDRAILADYDQLTEFLDGQLRLGVLLEEEDQILNGNGTPPNLRGILAQTGIQTQAKGGDPVPDAVYKAITKVRAQFFEPDAIVFHPNDWQAVRLLSTADGEYIAGNMTDADDERLWGKPVIVSPLIAENTALVGAFGVAATVYDREQARVTFTESGLGDSAGQELFTRNQIRFRGESRIAFGVAFPAAFCTVTGV